MTNTFLDSIKVRRSIYALDKNVSLSQNEIEEIIKEAVKLSPSSFNSQSSRAVILFGESHDKLWNITEETLRGIVPAENFASTEEKIASFRAGYGTVLFFEDTEVIEGLQENFALYADNFPIWSEQSTGIAQHSVWVALANAGIGASLQHYNPLIDDAVQAEFDLPESWNLRAQMPFGNIVAEAGEKEFIDDEKRFRTFK
ncbi:putative nitroreductase HBN1 [Listeria fleischmannii 1991]|jgi:predicted oxidoreductase (fatty acid repression mutant protein)|uniref:Nitroreductase family n=4 Tax=Listeria fleischmannii TaxID=1069827 RepID=A0A2X3H897_9LIST|nr:nitroreductase family protein [Listeria fleischmannii]EIA20115.1 nitroreductase family protein [Listeria fleischmannii subsp. coloradonensis]EMG26789.1 nitroreductase family protein [Listeria fleischmannii subsp. fleischmannii LU2006-1]EUJ47141.1 putative nitroreductase HBN1 [Listeria fleischmannii FSL S10-1203]KMT60009.1 putative nitroreductase HBN1 [Listeria fleischmannii 1991]MBC1398147.1 nitroreductase family protein [Listeria fleischmannii]